MSSRPSWAESNADVTDFFAGLKAENQSVVPEQGPEASEAAPQVEVSGNSVESKAVGKSFNIPEMVRGLGTMISDLDLRERVANIDWKEKGITVASSAAVGFLARAGFAAIGTPAYAAGILGGVTVGVYRGYRAENKKIAQDAIHYKIENITAQLEQNQDDPVALAAVMVKARQLIADGRNFAEDKNTLTALESKLTEVEQRLENPEVEIDKKQQLEYILSQLKGKQRARVDKLEKEEAKKILKSVLFESETREVKDARSRRLKSMGKGAVVGAVASAVGYEIADKIASVLESAYGVAPEMQTATKVAVNSIQEATRQAKEQAFEQLQKLPVSVQVAQGSSVYAAIREMAHNRLVVEGKFTDGLSSAANHIPEKYLPAFQEYVADAVTKRHKEAITIIREGKTIIWDGSPSSILPADRIQIPDSVLSEAITQAKQKLATPQLEHLTEAYVSQVKPEVVASLKADEFIGSSPKIGDQALPVWWSGEQQALQAALKKNRANFS